MISTPRRVALALGLVTMLFAGVACAKSDPDSGVAEQLRRDVDAIHALGISGVQARVIRPDGAESVVTAGTSDLTSGAPVDPDGYFRMASTSKTLIATVILQLAAEGKLSLEDSVEHWLPNMVHGNGNDGNAITVRQLLQHTSGIHNDLPGYTTAQEYVEQRYDTYTPEQLVARAMSHAPDFAPGQGWEYANTGYTLLTMIIEKATGRPSHEEIETRILHPLALDHTRWLGTSSTLPAPHTKAYQLFGPDSKVDVTDQIPIDPETLSWVTTTHDENIFFRALLSGRLLPAPQLAAMRDTVPVSADLEQLWPNGKYGLGLAERPLPCGGTYWSHEGGDGGYITLNGVTPDGTRSAVVSMSEAMGDTPDHIRAQESAATTLITDALCPPAS
ncbi:serine hydrolase domain-containing protein [Nocardia sp. CDC160]|uniref:serine hydrolase domain-containing protein n=1 Tax=Nocardia sp. CDC160 TaxID=3112166 RepID=UPI002DB958AE|nr:serine hydrolase domain-containing protein [Nocardia sp. CDC160]MEC3918593.1 serine hydrolase domain-containing protein [Nocardia sp. CDC160]